MRAVGIPTPVAFKLPAHVGVASYCIYVHMLFFHMHMLFFQLRDSVAVLHSSRGL